MVDISIEEVKKIAKMSGMSLDDKEAGEFFLELKQLLTYTEQIQNLSLGSEIEAYKSVNVFREDKPEVGNCEAATESFQQVDGPYLVVPKVLD